jgi:hypothetical protein
MDLKKTNAPVNTITYNKLLLKNLLERIWSDNHWLKEANQSIKLKNWLTEN